MSELLIGFFTTTRHCEVRSNLYTVQSKLYWLIYLCRDCFVPRNDVNYSFIIASLGEGEEGISLQQVKPLPAFTLMPAAPLPWGGNWKIRCFN